MVDPQEIDKERICSLRAVILEAVSYVHYEKVRQGGGTPDEYLEAHLLPILEHEACDLAEELRRRFEDYIRTLFLVKLADELVKLQQGRTPQVQGVEYIRRYEELFGGVSQGERNPGLITLKLLHKLGELERERAAIEMALI